MRPVVRRIQRRLGVVTAVSPVAASVLGEAAEVRIIPNGIDLARYREGEVAAVPGRTVFVGRDDPRKGLDVLLEAWPEVLRGHPGAELRVVGADRPDEVAGVTFLGRVDEARKVTELRSAQVLVAPNRGGESFGIVVLEGLAAGCAVVASDLAAFRAVAGDAAHYVPVGDAGALAGAILGLLGDEQAMTNLGERGIRRSGEFDRDSVLAAYLEAYRDAIGES
jgi:phosphatidylinositol alpha-mannosyltransferase